MFLFFYEIFSSSMRFSGLVILIAQSIAASSPPPQSWMSWYFLGYKHKVSVCQVHDSLMTALEYIIDSGINPNDPVSPEDQCGLAYDPVVAIVNGCEFNMKSQTYPQILRVWLLKVRTRLRSQLKWRFDNAVTRAIWRKDYFGKISLSWLNIAIQGLKQASNIYPIFNKSRAFKALCDQRDAEAVQWFTWPIDHYVMDKPINQKIHAVLKIANSIAWSRSTSYHAADPDAINGENVLVRHRRYIARPFYSTLLTFIPSRNNLNVALTLAEIKHLENLYVEKILAWVGFGLWRVEFTCSPAGPTYMMTPFAGVAGTCDPAKENLDGLEKTKFQDCLKSLGTMHGKCLTSTVSLKQLRTRLKSCIYQLR